MSIKISRINRIKENSTKNQPNPGCSEKNANNDSNIIKVINDNG